MSVYRITEKASAFAIDRLAYDRVTVELQPWAFSVTSDGYTEARCGLYGSDQLDLLVATRLLGEDDPTANLGDVSSALRRTLSEARAIRTDVGLQRIRLLAQVDPAVHQVQLIALRVAGRVPLLAQDPALYREPYVLRDILNYRAAAIALAHLHSELGGGESPPSVEALIAAMANWRGLFSPDGRPYRSLNRTLMNLPGDVPPELVCELAKVRLERPILHGLELTTLMLYVSNMEVAESGAGDRFRLFHHASAAEIADAMRRIGESINRELFPGRLDDLRFVIRYLCDYPEPDHGTLPGLVDRVIGWHRRAYERARLEDLVMRLGGRDCPTARPPIALPSLPGVTFLATVGDVAEEGSRMKHCIATRAKDAVDGRCFLFHVDYQGEQASVEVSAQGTITDAEGPRNSKNDAAPWGARQLRAWAEGFAPQKATVGFRPMERPNRPRPRPYADPPVPELIAPPQRIRRPRRGRSAHPDQLAFPF